MGQLFWILVTNKSKKIIVGVNYPPHRNVTPNNEFKIVCEDIREQTKTEKEENREKVIIGDFNANIGPAIEGNKKEVIKGGRQPLKLASKENVLISNTVKEKCKGLWTRMQGEENSIADYVLTDTTSANIVN